jgi:hypothetical protein
LATSAVAAPAKNNKDVILVLDTSMSMIGYGGSDIFGQVKNSVSKYIESLAAGDRVTFVTFDSSVKMFPTIIVDDSNDKEILKKYISMTEAKGLWTNTFAMVKTVYEKATELEADQTRYTVIVIMTDGIDDPSPDNKKKKVALTDIFGVPGGDRWVYLVNFNDLKNNENFNKFKEKLVDHGANIKVVDSSDDPAKGLKDVQEEISRMEAEKRTPIWPFILLILVIAGAAAYILARRNAQLKVKGKLEYWCNEMLNPYTELFDLGRRNIKEVYVGKGPKTLYHISDIYIDKPIIISSVREKGVIKTKITPGDDYKIEYVNRDGGGYLEDGDIFKVENYTFKYFLD